MTSDVHTRVPVTAPERGVHHKWIALSNTTLGILMATINNSILLIALPDIFRGIEPDPLAPGTRRTSCGFLMGFLLVSSELVVSLGRIGDMYGRVRMFDLGFAVFTVFSILLSESWMTGVAAALWMIVMRIGQGIGGAFPFANSSASITDAFPEDRRGLAPVCCCQGRVPGRVQGAGVGTANGHEPPCGARRACVRNGAARR